MRWFLIFLTIILSGCFKSTEYYGDSTIMSHYGEECFEKPYINKYGDSYLCQANAISKHNKQVDIHNKAVQE